MNVYEYRLRPLAAWGTPWHADTLWGSLCWAWGEATSAGELERLLKAFALRRPPFTISDAFPAGLLPSPIGVRLNQEPGKEIKSRWCRTADFASWAEGYTNTLPIPDRHQLPVISRALMHVQMSRNTEAAEAGGLFAEDHYTLNPETFPTARERTVSVYVRILPEYEDREKQLLAALSRCWEVLGEKGFGRRASVGLGVFKLESGPEPCPWLNIQPGHSGFVSLSHFAPARQDPQDGLWRVHAKNPKFAGDRVPQFLKGNLITLTPGSRFQTNGPPRPFYGRMLPMPRDGFPNALHYGLSFVAPVKWRP